MKKILFLVLSFFSYAQTYATTMKDSMFGAIGESSSSSTDLGVTGDGMTPVENIISYLRGFIFDVLYLVVIGVFLYLGARLVSARGKPDELKKVINAFIYVVVGLTVIPLAYAAVKLIASLNI